MEGLECLVMECVAPNGVAQIPDIADSYDAEMIQEKPLLDYLEAYVSVAVESRGNLWQDV